VQIGVLSGQDISLPGAVLRSKNLTIRGSGPGSWSMKELTETLGDLLAIVGSIPEQPVKVVKVEDVEKAWDERSSERTVILVG